MNEILNLAEKFKQKSDKTAESIDSELNNVMQTLNDSMIAKLKESESIIKNGIQDLSVSNEELQEQLTQHLAVIRRTVDDMLSQFQTHLYTRLESDLSDLNEIMESHTSHIQQLIQNREDRIKKVITSGIGKWTTIAVIALLVVFALGLILGAKLNNKPTTYKYYHDSKTGQTYMLPMQD